MDSSPNTWLIGSGSMAQAYADVLRAQDVAFRVIGRGAVSAETFLQATGVPVLCGGLDAALAELPVPEQAIVAVGVEHLAQIAQRLIGAGCRRLLLEKPGALHLAEIKALYAAAEAAGSRVWIAYNRRFYSSVKKLRQLAEEDGGIVSAVFEFTEWSHSIRDLPKAPEVKENWLLANSTHVIDLAFYLIGLPAEGQWQAWNGGSLDWHTSAARFHGAGVSERGVPFSYQADWEAPGRWGVEMLTCQNRYLLRPMEMLQTIPLGSVNAKPIALDDELDNQFKPGLFCQCNAFLTGESSQMDQLCSLEDHLKAFPSYCRIAGYSF